MSRVASFLLVCIVVMCVTSVKAQTYRGVYQAFDYSSGWAENITSIEAAAAAWEITDQRSEVETSEEGTIIITLDSLCEYIDSGCAILVLCGHGFLLTGYLYFCAEVCYDYATAVFEENYYQNTLEWASDSVEIFDVPDGYVLGLNDDGITDYVLGEISDGMSWETACNVFGAYCESAEHANVWLPAYSTTEDHAFIGWDYSPTLYSNETDIGYTFSLLQCEPMRCWPYDEECTRYWVDHSVDGVVRATGETCGDISGLNCYMDDDQALDYLQADSLNPESRGCADNAVEAACLSEDVATERYNSRGGS